MKNVREAPVLDRKKFPNLVIVGATASGKTTVSYQLSKVLGFGFVDVDAIIEERDGRSIQEIFATDGMERFRQRETEVIASLDGIHNHVIVAGAGAVETPENWDLLKKLGPSIWLATPVAEIVHRLLKYPEELSKRPMLADAMAIEDKKAKEDFLVAKLKELEDRRTEGYSQADYRLTIGFATADTCAQFIKQILIEGQVS